VLDSGLLTYVGVLKLKGTSLGLAAVLVKTNAELLAGSCTGRSLALYVSPLAELMARLIGVLPVGSNRSTTLLTLPKVKTGLSTLSGNSLDEHKMLCTLGVEVVALVVSLVRAVLFGDYHRVLSTGICISFCENGNNAANAHNNGQEKSKNSFRIVLH
jgi:hypothetical protein